MGTKVGGFGGTENLRAGSGGPGPSELHQEFIKTKDDFAKRGNKPNHFRCLISRSARVSNSSILRWMAASCEQVGGICSRGRLGKRTRKYAEILNDDFFDEKCRFLGPTRNNQFLLLKKKSKKA